MSLTLQPIVKRIRILAVCCVFASSGMILGCDNSNPTAENESESEEMHDDHDHDDHDHDDHAGHDHAGHDHGNPEELGPNGGHLIHLHPSHGNVEWTHDDETSEVTVYVESLLAGDAKADGVYVQVKTAVGDEERFDFDSEDSKVFSIKNPSLMGSLEIGEEAAKCTLVVSIDGVEQTGSIKCEDHSGHDHHGHSH